MKLLPCPCGKTPTNLELHKNSKWCEIWPSCCGEWGCEFRIKFADNFGDLMAEAIKAWNELPRGGMK